MIITNISFV